MSGHCLALIAKTLMVFADGRIVSDQAKPTVETMKALLAQKIMASAAKTSPVLDR